MDMDGGGNGMKTKSVRVNALFNSLYTLTNMAFPLLTLPYVSRMIGPEGLGTVNFYTSVSNYAVTVAALGISTYGIRQVAKVRENKRNLAKTAKELFCIHAVSSSLVAASLLFSMLFVARFRQDFRFLLVHAVLILSTPLGMEWFFQGTEQYSYITKRNFAVKAISLVPIFLFIRTENDALLYAAVLALGSVGGYFFNFFYAGKFVFAQVGNLNITRHIRPMLMLFASAMAINVYINLDKVMLGFLCGDSQVGQYSIAVYVKSALLTLVNAASIVLLPRISAYRSLGEGEKITALIRRSFTLILLFAAPMAAFFMIEAYDCVMVLGGSGYPDSVLCMQVIMPVLLISGISNITGNQILIPMDLERYYTIAVSTGAAVDLALNLLLMPRLGCVGAAAATLVAEIVQMSIQAFCARKYLFRCVNLRSAWKTAAATAASSAALLACRHFLHFSSLGNLFLAGACFSLIYAVMLLVLREKETKDLMASLWRIFKR